MDTNEKKVGYAELAALFTRDKKVVCVNHTLRYKEDMNPPRIEGKNTSWSSDKLKYTDVVYVWSNPQMNRIFAQLVDGREVEYNLSFLDVYWSNFTEYIPPIPPERGWRDVFDGQKIFPQGYNECRAAARVNGYTYLAFNGIVFHVNDKDMHSPVCDVEELK